MPAAHIVLRQSPDWGALTDEQFRHQSREFCDQIGYPTEMVNRSVDLWNRTFRRPYLDIRREMKELALGNLRSVAGASLVEGALLKQTREFQPGLYLFSDDDDWMHPDIVRLVSQAAPDAEAGVVWGSVAFGGVDKALVRYRELNGFCFTNNYAVTGQYLARKPARLDAVFQHTKASKTLSAVGVPTVAGHWSITNKSPVSTVSFRQAFQGNYESAQPLVRLVEDYQRRFEEFETQAHPDLDWARPLMLAIGAIFRAL
jgi:hypothetical protein